MISGSCIVMPFESRVHSRIDPDDEDIQVCFNEIWQFLLGHLFLGQSIEPVVLPPLLWLLLLFGLPILVVLTLMRSA